MATINLKAGNDYVEPTLKSGDEYKLEFKGLYSSLFEGKERLIDKKTGEEYDYISINAQVVSDGAPHVYTGHFFKVKIGNEWNKKSMAQITDLYTAATGKEAPEAIDVDEFFIDLEGKTFMSKVFLKTDKEGNEILNDRGDRQYTFSPWVRAFDPEADNAAPAANDYSVENAAADLLASGDTAATNSETETPFSDMFK